MDMDMDMGSGLDSAGASMFHADNYKIALDYWYIIAAVVGVLACRQLVDRGRVWLRNRGRKMGKAAEALFQTYDTIVTIFREASYPAIAFNGAVSRYFTPLSLGKWLFLLTYWVVILTMLWSNVILSKTSSLYAYKWEIVGFRAAWVSVTQIPLVYCLASKINIISLLTGISYERLQWFHRWAARTLFLSLIVHWSYFYREWDLAKFVKLELELMPMVKYGFGAWGVIGWMVLSGTGIFRSQCYELFVLQHLAAAGALLWLVYIHVPSYARYNVWLSIAFIAFDRIARIFLLAFRNVNLRKLSKLNVGYESEVTALPGGYLHVAIKDAAFKWRAGQHVYITLPWVGIIESHPFTISNTCDESQNLNLYIKCHGGFTRRLFKSCQQSSPRKYRAFVSGPWGNPPLTDRYESMALLACGTGASFTVPIFHEASKQKTLRQLRFIWIMRDQSQLDWFREQIIASVRQAKDRDIDVTARIFVTDPSLAEGTSASSFDISLPEKSVTERVAETRRSNSSSKSEDDDILISYGRPALDPLLLPTIERAAGETGFVACGGASFMADVRNYIAKTSDERAVHKGTGAHGLHLYTEQYGW